MTREAAPSDPALRGRRGARRHGVAGDARTIRIAAWRAPMPTLYRAGCIRRTTSPGPSRNRRAASPRDAAATRARSRYDVMLADDGQGMLLLPILNYADGNLDPGSARCSRTRGRCSGWPDGGAHFGMICDASMPTFMLTHWVRDRTRGPRLPLEQGGAEADVRHRPAVRACTRRGLLDRGCGPTSI